MNSFSLVLFATSILAYLPLNTGKSTRFDDRATSFEWIVWGDSYASGVGSGDRPIWSGSNWERVSTLCDWLWLIFNDQDPGCNNVTFARTTNLNPDNKQHPLMTTDLHQDFNLMSVTLNPAIKEAVHQNSGSNVKHIDIDVLLGADHLFCEPGVNEPDLNNPKLWCWHYPYDSNEENEILMDPTIIYLNSVQQADIDKMPWDQNSTLWSDYLDDFWSKFDENQPNQTFGGNVTMQTNFWSDFVGHGAGMSLA